MRGMLEELASPVPLLHQLPGTYQDGDFTARLAAVMDATLAPVFTTVDNLAAYVDPATAPSDLLAYIGGWVQAALDQQADVADRRRSVQEAVGGHRLRGTCEGVRRLMAALAADGLVEVTESGASAWSTTPGSALPGTAPGRVTVIVRSPEPVDEEAIRAALNETVPAHVQWTVEVVSP